MADRKPKPVRVAIVGSGLAGLATAYLLHRDPRRRFEVTVFESGKSLSLDSASVSLSKSVSDTDERIDMPMRSFAGGLYKNLQAMYDFLGVGYRPQPFFYEFVKYTSPKSYPDHHSSYFIHASNLHRIPPPAPKRASILAYSVELIYVMACYAWFSFCCMFVAPRAAAGLSESLDDYLRRIRLPQYFVTFYLLPVISSVATCPHKALLAFPASDLTEYKRLSSGAPHYRVLNGVREVQEKLVRGIKYKLTAVVSAVTPSGKVVKINGYMDTPSGPEEFDECFDRVVLAVPPDVVARVFSPLERAMKKVPTIGVQSVAHTDRRHFFSDMPQWQKRPDDSGQLIVFRTSTDTTHRTESIHVQPSGVLVSNDPLIPIDPDLVIQSANFTRVLRTPESRWIVNNIFGETHQRAIRLDEKSESSWKNGDGNVWLVGGWCWDGMVLLEGCVVSAMRVADAFGVEIPWRT